MDTLKSLSPVLYHTITSSSPDLQQLFSQSHSNLTFFLPNPSAIHALNLTNNDVYTDLTLMVLNGSYPTQSLLHNRTEYTTLLSNHTLFIGPSINTDSVRIISGSTASSIEQPNIVCDNGIIHVIDAFLTPSQTPLMTISQIPETDYFEELLVSLNISDIISGHNKTILAPNNAAWEKVNGTSLPFGTLLHNLKYLVIDGVYLSHQLKELSLAQNESNYAITDYKHYPIFFQSEGDTLLAIAHTIGDTARLTQTDIITTSGVIHIIDHVISVNMIDDTLSSIAANNYSSNGNTGVDFESNSITVTPFNTSKSYHCILCTITAIITMLTFVL